MPGALTGKVALVTGAARGIGRADRAASSPRAGCDVAVNYYNSADEAEALCAEIRALGRRAVAIQGSVGIPDSVDEMFAEFGKHFDRLDIVVSNAASGVLKPTVEMTLKHWRWCMETNALALNLLAQRALPLMTDGGAHHRACRASARSARCPATASSARRRRRSESLARALAQELGPRGIRVNVGERRRRRHRRARATFPNREELLANFAQRTPAGPVLTPEDVAGAVYLLCLPEAAMINGHTLVVDGGFAHLGLSAIA